MKNRNILILCLYIFMLLSSVVFADDVLTNAYCSGKTNVSAEVTVTFPAKTRGITVVNYDLSSVLLVDINSVTFEVDPTISQVRNFPIQISSLKLRPKTLITTAEVGAIY